MSDELRISISGTLKKPMNKVGYLDPLYTIDNDPEYQIMSCDIDGVGGLSPINIDDKFFIFPEKNILLSNKYVLEEDIHIKVFYISEELKNLLNNKKHINPFEKMEKITEATSYNEIFHFYLATKKEIYTEIYPKLFEMVKKDCIKYIKDNLEALNYNYKKRDKLKYINKLTDLLSYLIYDRCSLITSIGLTGGIILNFRDTHEEVIFSYWFEFIKKEAEENKNISTKKIPNDISFWKQYFDVLIY